VFGFRAVPKPQHLIVKPAFGSDPAFLESRRSNGKRLVVANAGIPPLALKLAYESVH